MLGGPRFCRCPEPATNSVGHGGGSGRGRLHPPNDWPSEEHFPAFASGTSVTVPP